MSLTHFPNGITAQAASAANSSAGAGDMDCNNLYVAGVASFGTSDNGIVGQAVSIPLSFGTSSVAQIVSAAVPFTGQIVGAFVTIGSVSAVAAGYTVRVGSAGSVAVATVSNTITASYAGQALTTTKTAITTADGIQVTRAAQGTAGDTYLTLLLQRTA